MAGALARLNCHLSSNLVARQQMDVRRHLWRHARSSDSDNIFMLSYSACVRRTVSRMPRHTPRSPLLHARASGAQIMHGRARHAGRAANGSGEGMQHVRAVPRRGRFTGGTSMLPANIFSKPSVTARHSSALNLLASNRHTWALGVSDAATHAYRRGKTLWKDLEATPPARRTVCVCDARLRVPADHAWRREHVRRSTHLPYHQWRCVLCLAEGDCHQRN